MGAKSPSVLASFAHNWVGGDIHGLSALAGTLYGYQPKIDEVVNFLNTSVGKVAHDAGWSGDAASSFEAAWETDSLAAQTLESVIGSIGDVIDTLAVNLAEAESALEDAAGKAQQAGVAIGDGGAPPTAPAGPPGPAPAAGTPAAATAQTAGEYATMYAQTLQIAEQARVDAATQLQQLYFQIAPPGAPGAPTLGTGDNITVGDYLRGLWTIPSAYSKVVKEKAEQAEKDAVAAKDAWTKAKNARPNPRVPIPQDVKDSLHDANSRLKNLEDKLTGAEGTESKFLGSKALDVRLSTALEAIGVEAKGAFELDFLKKATKFAGDVPGLDILAAGFGTYFGAKDDIEKGMPWYEAVPENALSNVGSLAIGAAAGAAVYGAIEGGSVVLAVGAGAVVGGVVCVGVGDFASNLFHEHWDEDMKKDGPIGGIAVGIGNSAVNTGKDMVKLGEKTANSVAGLGKKIWHSIF
ncbi:WXG100 family type VII secretion target [Kitasatospora viridis]|uniref:Uncharacterized protein YukE n=1 Tax=Kitasatospora viridis TaxID=281105 RepID=A0A561UEY0_9ACTN|nr:WXG100 family type VII secretion target [Kitasatospora viridis]TWF97916.1 uncharacterized protein YukE [Kitasatospora viridis]